MSEVPRIVIAERGWVFVGFVRREGDQYVIERCFNIRRWGTLTGLGQLAMEGPQPDTVLDYYGVFRNHILAEVGQIEASWPGWPEWLRRAR